jgi:flagellin
MSLGVLNNLSAVYAENYLNSTNSSLNTVLQQLSSGSKINSGADDAAGLSLVNGLQANQMALNQSQTNAQEGSGLLQVADGALSQVTSLLNRAVTLATEASNGTLNSTQETAANQEYQSILSEVNNIGSTTTYNDQAVFNSSTNIYTGDASTAGSAIDDLNIRSLSSSNLGDTSGNMSYTTAAAGNNVFMDLTVGTDSNNVANASDYLNGGSTGTTTLNITTLSSNGNSVTNPVTVGGTSGYDNTAQGLINAINNGGYGVTASFTTAAVAGATETNEADTGIMISGSVGAGTSPSNASFSGKISGETANTDIISGSLTLQVGNNASTTVTAAQVAAADGISTGAVSMTDFGNYITANAGLGVTASVSNGGVLSLSSSGSGDPQLKVTSNLVDNSLTTGAAALAYTATSAYSAGISTPAAGSSGVVDSGIGGAESVFAALAGNGGKAIANYATIAENSEGNFSGTLSVTGGGAIILGAAASGGAGTEYHDGTSTAAGIQYALNNDGIGGTGVWTATLSNGTLTLAASTAPTNNTTFSLAADATTVQSTADTPATGGTSSGGGVATIGYTDKAGESLSGTDLSSQQDAESALTDLNSAIADVAAQDGYVGAQINILDAVSSVLSTQSENVQAAQNAVQSTDYAQATSNMSKYEILSQTGIAALAQANSQQQEVLKLLQ